MGAAGYPVLRLLFERYAAILFERLQSPQLAESELHFLRGQISAALSLADLPGQLLAKAKEYDDYASRSHRAAVDDRAADAFHWGSPVFTDRLSSNRPEQGD